MSKAAVEPAGKHTRVHYELDLPVGSSKAIIDYLVADSGALSVTVTVEVAKGVPMLPRFGMQTEMPAAFRTWKWFGKGPHENYWDRQDGAWIGSFSGTVDDLFHHYVDPQESGNRCEVRDASFSNPAGEGLKIEALGDSLLEISAYPFSPANIESARHPVDLKSADTTINIDLHQMGLGGTTSWGALPLDRYRLKPGNSYTYSFSLSPL